MITPFPYTNLTETYNTNLTVRVGCRLTYQTAHPASILLLVCPHPDNNQFIRQEILSFRSKHTANEYHDAQGNLTHRWVLEPGETTIVYDALVDVSSLPDNSDIKSEAVPVEQISSSVLRYTLPSRYCDSDKLLGFSAAQFGTIRRGLEQVIAICNWVQGNIRYVTYSGRADISASEVFARGFGVCRDFAHVAIALCRALNLPARYVTGYLPDIACFDPGTPMDFHAYFEVYLEHQWCTFDARFNTPRIGRVKIAHGLDAVDGSFSTTYGEAPLTFFEVWTYQVNPGLVSIGDPIDLSKRLDGTPLLRFV